MRAPPRWARVGILLSLLIGAVVAALYARRADPIYPALGAVALGMLWAGLTAASMMARRLREAR